MNRDKIARHSMHKSLPNNCDYTGQRPNNSRRGNRVLSYCYI